MNLEEFVSYHLLAHCLIKSEEVCNENMSMYCELHFLHINSCYEPKSNFLQYDYNSISNSLIKI